MVNVHGGVILNIAISINNIKLSASFIAILFLLYLSHVSTGFAAIYNVNDQTGLINAITSINTNPGTTPLPSANTVNLLADITLTQNLPVLLNGATFVGTNGSSNVMRQVSGDQTGISTYRLFATSNASIDLQYITLHRGRALGGSGYGSGGGGLGAGGGIYVDLGQTVSINNVTIQNCLAQGGNGGNFPAFVSNNGGGGGASFSVTTNINASSGGPGGDNPGVNGGGGSGAGGAASKGTLGYGGGGGSSGSGGGATGGGGGGGNNAGAAGGASSSAGGAGGYCGGGGGGGSSSTSSGGGGGNGGGQGGQGALKGGGGGGFGSGGASGGFGPGGGGGGFGGGGGGYNGGGGGFGGGGAANQNVAGASGGTYGGSGAGGTATGGGGGGGLGGGVFVGDGATLCIGDSVTFTSNNVTGGSASSPGTGGTGFAADIFLFRAAKLKFNGTATVFASFPIQSNINAPAGHFDSGVQVEVGAATNVNLASNSSNYRGGITLTSGIASVGVEGTAGGSSALGYVPTVPTANNIVFNGGTLATNNIATLNSNRSITLNAGGGTISSTAGSLTYGGVISGSGALTLTPVLTVILSGANTYTGQTNINSGSVSISNNNNLGDSSNINNTLSLNGGGLTTTADISMSRKIFLNSSIVSPNFRTNSGTTLTLTGIVDGNSDVGQLYKSGAGTLDLAGSNVGIGAISIDDGILKLSNSNAINGSGGISVFGSPTLQAATNITTTRSMLLAGSLTIQADAPVVLSGVISTGSAGAFTKNGASTLTLAANNSFSNQITMNAGTLVINHANALGTGSGGLFNITFGGTSTIQSAVAASTNRLISLNSGQTATIQTDAQLTIGGDVSGTGILTKTGASILTLSGNNTYTGAVNINAGTLQLSSTNALGGGSNAITFGGAGTLQSSAIISSSRTVSLSAAATIQTDSALTLSGVISGSNSLTKTGTDTLTLSGANSYTGATNINVGTISIANTNNLGNSANTITFNGGTLLTTNAAAGTSRNVTLNAGGGTIQTNTADVTFSGVFSGTGALTKTGANVLTLSGANSYTGATNVNAGTLQAAASSINSSSVVTVAGNSTFNLTSGTMTQTFTNSGTINVYGSLNPAVVATNNNVINIKSGGAMQIANSITGSGTIANESGAVLTLTSGGTTNPITNANGGILSVTGSVTSAGITNSGNMSIAGSVSGSGTIANESGAVLTLTSGGTTNPITNANGGILAVTGNVTSANITNSGAMNIAGNITMGSSTLQNNNGGVVTVSGQRSLGNGTYDNSGVHNTTITNVSTFDALTTNGSVNLVGAAINVTSSVNLENTWTVIQGSGITYNSTTKVNTPASTLLGVWSSNFTGTALTVTYNGQTYTDIATGDMNQKIAAVLDAMANSPTNSGQQELLNAFNSSVNQAEFNESLHQMMPIANALIYDMQMQNIVFTKLSSRVASVRDDWQRLLPSTGISAGDLNPDNSIWISTTGNITSQNARQDDDGYNAKTSLFLLGMDTHTNNYTVGMAGGYSYSRVREYSNKDFRNNIIRYHGLFYGTNYGGNKFVDWLFSGSYNNNMASRYINVSGNNFSTRGYYNGFQAATKWLAGINCDFADTYRVVPFAFLQYVFLRQNSYQETGSVAALSVAPINKNIATLGLGTRLDFPIDEWQMVGMRELRAAVGYDVINKDNYTTASFVVGSDSFSVVSSPEKFSLMLGAGLNFELCNHLHFSIDYDFEYRVGMTDHTGLIKFKWVF